MDRSRTILLAEDDENDAFLLKTALSTAGVTNPVVHVPNGEAAYHYLAGEGDFSDRTRHPFPCLLITDLKMPGISGFDLLSRARPILEAEQVPAVVLSASGAESDRERSLELGASQYYVKPSDFAAFIALAAELRQSWLEPVTRQA